MRLFNAFQITGAFVAWPYLIQYLSDASFRGVSVAFWSACAFYVVAFFFMTASVYNSIDPKNDWF